MAQHSNFIGVKRTRRNDVQRYEAKFGIQKQMRDFDDGSPQLRMDRGLVMLRRDRHNAVRFFLFTGTTGQILTFQAEEIKPAHKALQRLQRYVQSRESVRGHGGITPRGTARCTTLPAHVYRGSAEPKTELSGSSGNYPSCRCASPGLVKNRCWIVQQSKPDLLFGQSDGGGGGETARRLLVNVRPNRRRRITRRLTSFRGFGVGKILH
jgi:hypothetical protein